MAAAPTGAGENAPAEAVVTKYPRTPHLPFSPGMTDDDVTLATFDRLIGPNAPDVVVTEKLDGGNCCIKDGTVFARTHGKPATHSSFETVRAMWKTKWQYLLEAVDGGADGALELYGENMTAQHSIAYTDAEHPLPSCLYLLAVFDRRLQQWHSWDQVRDVAAALELPTPPVLFRGQLATLQQLEGLIAAGMAAGSRIGHQAPAEGFVVRTAAAIDPQKFSVSIAKFVRPGHVQTGDDFKWAYTRANVLLE